MKYQTMFDYFDANDFELNLTNQTATIQSEVAPNKELGKDEEEEKVSSNPRDLNSTKDDSK